MPAVPNLALLGLVAAAYLFSQHQGAPSAPSPPSAPAPPAPPPPPAAPAPPAPAPGTDLAPLLQQLAALQTLLDQVRQQNQVLVSQIAQAQQDIQAQQQALNALDQDLSQLQQQAQGLQQTLTVLQQQLDQAQAQLAAVQEDNAALASQVAQAQQVVQAQEQSLNALNQDLAQLQQQAQGLQQTAAGLQQQLDQARAQLAAVQQDNQTLASLQIPQAQAVVSHQQDQLQQLQQTIQSLQAQVAQLQQQVADLQALLQASQKDLQDARNANAALDQQIAQMQQTIQNQTQRIQELQQTNQALQAQVAYLQQQIVQLNALLQTAQQNLAEAQKANVDLDAQIRSMVDTINKQNLYLAAWDAHNKLITDLIKRLEVVVGYFRVRRETEVLNQTVQNQVAASGIEARWHRVSAEVIQGTMVQDWVHKIQAMLPKPVSRGPVAWNYLPETVLVKCTGVNLQVRLFYLPFDQTVTFRWSASGANTGFLGLVWNAGGVRAFDQGQVFVNDWQLGSHPKPETGQKIIQLPSGVYALLAYTSGGGNGQAQIQADFQIYDTRMPPIPPPPTMPT